MILYVVIDGRNGIIRYGPYKKAAHARGMVTVCNRNHNRKYGRWAPDEPQDPYYVAESQEIRWRRID